MKFNQRLPEEPSQPNPIGRCLDVGEGSCDFESIDRGGSHTGVTLNSVSDRGQAGHYDFHLVRATVTISMTAAASSMSCNGRGLALVWPPLRLPD
jgi:hypothetical protein